MMIFRKIKNNIKSLPLIVIFYAFSFYFNLQGEQKSLESLIVINFSMIDSAEYISVIKWIFLFLSLLLPTYIFAGTYREDLERSYTYIFTRFGSKSTWLRNISLELLARIFIFQLFRLIIVIILSISVAENKYMTREQVFTIFLAFLLNTLHLAFWIMLENIIAVRLGDESGTIIILGAFILSIIITLLAAHSNMLILLYALPSSNAMFLWHVACGNADKFQVAEFYIMPSILIIAVYIVIIYFSFLFKIKNKDSFDLMGG